MASVIVVMGVSGAGKTMIGRAIARASRVPFQEGDDLHPAANVAKMRGGVPLDDADRAPWLDAVAGWIAAHRDGGGVVSCSALKRAYRDRLRIADPGALRFVLPDVDRATLRARIAGRRGHFMPAALLDSQLNTLERPQDEPDILMIDGTAPVVAAIDRVRAWLRQQ